MHSRIESGSNWRETAKKGARIAVAAVALGISAKADNITTSLIDKRQNDQYPEITGLSTAYERMFAVTRDLDRKPAEQDIFGRVTPERSPNDEQALRDIRLAKKAIDETNQKEILSQLSLLENSASRRVDNAYDIDMIQAQQIQESIREEEQAQKKQREGDTYVSGLRLLQRGAKFLEGLSGLGLLKVTTKAMQPTKEPVKERLPGRKTAVIS